MEVHEQDRYLPIANISRIMKRSIPQSAKISKDAKECVQECVSEFIAFITSEASDKCKQEKRKTINGDDLLYAMTALGFDKYTEPLRVYLSKYREGSLDMINDDRKDKDITNLIFPVGMQHPVNVPSSVATMNQPANYLMSTIPEMPNQPI